jgi:pyruvate/2-oxoglutarate dehydrogenase complex dihydrolipoamide acyltransferase (E2) component
MAIELKMPALSPTMEEGTLAKWLVKEGDTVKSGDILAEIETDKATMEFEAIDEGVVGRILIPEGTEGVKVGTVIAVIGDESEEARVSAKAETSGTASLPPEAPASAGEQLARPAPSQRKADPARIFKPCHMDIFKFDATIGEAGPAQKIPRLVEILVRNAGDIDMARHGSRKGARHQRCRAVVDGQQ